MVVVCLFVLSLGRLCASFPVTGAIGSHRHPTFCRRCFGFVLALFLLFGTKSLSQNVWTRVVAHLPVFPFCLPC